MKIEKENLRKAIRSYEGYGLVTRKMVKTLDSSAASVELFRLMKEAGCKNMIMSLVRNNYEDYYNVIFNLEIFDTSDEVTAYIIKYNW